MITLKFKFLFLSFLLTASFSSFAYDWSEVKDVINNAIKENTLPGGVLLVGNKNEVLFHEAFGSIDGTASINSTSTLYDLASLTKIVATTTSIMILEEQGKLSLTDKVGKYFSKFSKSGKEDITLEQVLRHEAGFSSGQPALPTESFEEYFKRFLKAPLAYTPGSKFVYSDLGFILLAKIVEKVSGETIEAFAMKNIFIPLKMDSTFYRVPSKLGHLCAPTFIGRDLCSAHDPTAYKFSSDVLGHAGVFSTAENLSHLAAMYLNLGEYKGVRLLKEATVKKMTTLPLNKTRGLGFDLLSAYAQAPRGSVFPAGISYGHTGYTGTTLWVDPVSGHYLVFLSNRVWLGDAETSKRFIKLRFDISSSVGSQVSP